VIGVSGNGRRRHSPASKHRLVDIALRPGASIPALAAHHGINAALLYKWVAAERRKRLDDALAPASAGERQVRQPIPAKINEPRERTVVAVTRQRGRRSDRELAPSSAGEMASGQFIPVEICDSRGHLGVSAVAHQRPRIDEQTSGFPPSRLTVAMPNGVMLTLDVGDMRVVSAMIAALGGCHVPV